MNAHHGLLAIAGSVGILSAGLVLAGLMASAIWISDRYDYGLLYVVLIFLSAVFVLGSLF